MPMFMIFHLVDLKKLLGLSEEEFSTKFHCDGFFHLCFAFKNKKCFYYFP